MEAAIAAALAETGITSLKQMGVVMKAAQAKLGGQARRRQSSQRPGARPAVLTDGLNKLLDSAGDLIADAAKNGKPFLSRARRGSRILEAPVQLRNRAGENGAGLLGRVADRDHPVERLAEELTHVL